MVLSTAAILTRQFYEWERLGRGWHRADRAVDLEPPFVPFLGHSLPEGAIIDDGKIPSLFQLLLGQRASVPQIKREQEEMDAYPFEDVSPLAIFSIAIPRDGRAHHEHMEQLLVMLSYRSRPMSFEIIGTQETISFQVTCRDTDAQYLLTQLGAFFPNHGIQQTASDRVSDILQRGPCLYTIDFGLEEEFMRPVAATGGDRECHVPLFGVIDRLNAGEGVIVQVLFSGVRNPWAEHMLAAVYDNDRKSPFFLDEPDMVRFAQEKASRPLCAATVRVASCAGTMEWASVLLEHAAVAVMHASRSAGNALIPLTDIGYTAQERLTDMLLRESRRTGMLLNTRELCTLAHFPLIPLKKLHQQRNTRPAPPSLAGHGYVLGLNEHNGLAKEVSLSTEQRLRHTHILGSTGTGKSTLLHSMMMEDTRLGNGYMCIDPHGDLIEMLLDTIPENRLRDVVLIDPTDGEYPIGFNILLAHSELEKELLASDLVALFRRFSTSWGDQMNSVFANAILAFLYNKEVGTLADLRRFLIEPTFRTRVLSTVTDPDIAYYWQREYPQLRGGSIGSILTRLDGFLRPRVIRNMVCRKESLDFAALMDGRKIILVKLSQGLLGAENSYLLGALVVSKLQQTAMARQAQARDARVPFYCYVDEFHHFVTPSMNEILSGARKYALGLILAHQDMQQVQRHDGDIGSSLLSNTAVRICFRLGDADAKRLQEGFSSFVASDLQDLPTGEAILRVNTAGEDCNLTVVPFNGEHESCRGGIVEHSRNTYSTNAPPAEKMPQDEPKPKTPRPPPTAAKSKKPNMPVDVPDPTDYAQKREHLYLQALIKGLAEQSGYRVQLEMRTPNGGGLVDVSLERDGMRIAVEISVTTTAEWELHNVRKCLGAGYDRVVVCCSDAKKRVAIAQTIKVALTEEERQRTVVIRPDEIQTILNVQTPTKERESVMKGYRVKVRYGDGADPKDVLSGLVSASRKK
jgi:hypothetical protein